MIEYLTSQEAIRLIKSDERIFIHGAAATPLSLVDALVQRHREIRNVNIVHLHTEGEAVYAHPQYSKSFTVSSFFVGSNIRPFVGSENVQYIPAFLSEIPAMFRRKILPLDVALVQVSEPDKHGYCSLGVSVDIAKAACDSASRIIGLINPKMPRSHGDGQIHYKRFAAMVHTEDELHESHPKQISDVENRIGRNVASLIEDGSTLQLGIGAVPEAVLVHLSNHKNLGVHTEMFSDRLLPLVSRGVINGAKKRNYQGRIVSSFAMGSRRLYDFIDDNPMVAMLDAGYVNDPKIIAANDKVVTINSALEIDLSGQVCADSLGPHIYSGVGGQMDFMRGATLSAGGKPIIAMPSRTGNGSSKIVGMLKPGAGVVTTRAHVHYVVTEFGIADLYGKTIGQRAKALIEIAHPEHREELEKSYKQIHTAKSNL